MELNLLTKRMVPLRNCPHHDAHTKTFQLDLSAPYLGTLHVYWQPVADSTLHAISIASPIIPPVAQELFVVPGQNRVSTQVYSI
jgi:hypothetical protein